jgi:uroporphyrinogen-III synthase
MSKPSVAVFRPDDDRIREATQYLLSLGVSPIADPMLSICPTGQSPKSADYTIFTSKTGVELATEQGWSSEGTIVCAVGQRTASALQNRGYSVDVLPETYTSSGLVEELSDSIYGQTVEIARSAHGSDVLVEGLKTAGAIVHETYLYSLERPTTAGHSVLLAIDCQIDVVLFTSPRTVTHFFAIADEQDSTNELQLGLANTIIGVIGTPTERAVLDKELSVDIKPETVSFRRLADLAVEQINARIR